MAATKTQLVPLTGPSSDELPPDAVVFGASAAMNAIRVRVSKVSSADIPVLIQGESGTGKEVIARMIHRASPRATGPFVKVNCPAIPGSLLESELFGYEKGSFTGAAESKPGRVEMANGGTLFLDEIAEMDIGLQAKLLQLLQDSQFWRLGGREDTKVDVRVICATNRDLEAEVQRDRFRQDLFYRINVVKIQLPPLRERREDLEPLVAYFLAAHSRRYGCKVAPLSAYVSRLLQKHPWAGNIRELSNLVERYTILGTEESVTNELLNAFSVAPVPEPGASTTGSMPLKSITRRTVQQLERKIILRTLIAHRWNRKRVAKDLKISYRALLYKIRQAGLPSRRPSGNGDISEVRVAPPSIPGDS